MKAKLRMLEKPSLVREVIIEELSESYTHHYREPWFKVLDTKTGIRVYASSRELSLSGVGSSV
jgi:hypothetical protein